VVYSENHRETASKDNLENVMKTEFTFESTHNGIVTATPEAVNYNGVSGNFWEFYGYDRLRDMSNVRLGKTFMKDRSTKKDIVEQFGLMG